MTQPPIHTLKLTLGPGESKEVKLVPFEKMSTADFIRITESEDQDEGGVPLITERNRIARILGIETRWVSVLSWEEVEQITSILKSWYEGRHSLAQRMAKVNETLNEFEKEHGRPFNSQDAKDVMEQFQVFRDTITVEGRTFRAPHAIETESVYGQWIDLQVAMNIEGPETESYVRALAIMMIEEGGEKWPSQRADESEEVFSDRLTAFIADRSRLFNAAPFVEVLGCAAFFFSRSERFALLCGYRMSRFQNLLRPASEPTSRVIPSDSELRLSLTPPQSTT